ncbi:MAG: hypothetical protein F6K63_29785 [Moorea sp. SIO1G6]|uniref:hypothetical protein n=1 Tax=Moorena sp. SIO1G6 TaxID=2607840 RepID=UPI0013C241CE|nr:hypothetical protein [Moorena sp. SIO1G6]NET68361.1 hypothetical protein [Moorena sp. SIO1G6]
MNLKSLAPNQAERLLILNCNQILYEPTSDFLWQNPLNPKRLRDDIDTILNFYVQKRYLIVGVSHEIDVGLGLRAMEDCFNTQINLLEELPQILGVLFCPDLAGQTCLWAQGYEILNVTHLSSYRGLYSKSSPGLVSAAIDQLGMLDRKQDCLYVGDHHDDQGIASQIGIPFEWAQHWLASRPLLN